MTDTAAPAKGLGATLGKKIGPFPLGVWAAGGIGVIWYIRKQQASASANPAAQQSQTGYGPDPAGNTGYIDPQTGYVYGSAEDISALQNEGLVGQNQYSGAGGTSGVGSTGDTSATGSGGTPAGSGTTTAPGTGTGTSTPPGTSGTPVKTGGGAAPKSNNWQYPKPAGLAANSVSDSGFGLSWSPVQGPNGQKPSTYTVQTYQGNTKVDQFISGSTSTKEYGAGGKGLKPATTYTVNVWANGGPVAPPHASIPVTTKPKGSK